MRDDDVPESDMDATPLTDEQLEAFLLGSDAELASNDAVAQFFAEARADVASVAPGEPSPELIAVMQSGASSPLSTGSAEVIDLTAASEARSRRTTVIGSLAAFAGTAIGKVALGSAAAAVSLVAVQAADLNIRGSEEATVIAVDPSSSSSSVTSSTSSTVTSTVPSGDSVGEASGELVTVPVAEAGSIDVRWSPVGVSLTGVSPAAGWVVDEIQELGGEVEVRFAGPGGQLVDVEVEIEDGRLKIRVRDRISGDETTSIVAAEVTATSTTTPSVTSPSTTSPSPTVTSSVTSPSTTSPDGGSSTSSTIDDDDDSEDDDDDSADGDSGSDDSDDRDGDDSDNSGPGNADDRDDAEDADDADDGDDAEDADDEGSDNSGPGNAEDRDDRDERDERDD